MSNSLVHNTVRECADDLTQRRKPDLLTQTKLLLILCYGILYSCCNI